MQVWELGPVQPGNDRMPPRQRNTRAADTGGDVEVLGRGGVASVGVGWVDEAGHVGGSTHI